MALVPAKREKPTRFVEEADYNVYVITNFLAQFFSKLNILFLELKDSAINRITYSKNFFIANYSRCSVEAVTKYVFWNTLWQLNLPSASHFDITVEVDAIEFNQSHILVTFTENIEKIMVGGNEFAMFYSDKYVLVCNALISDSFADSNTVELTNIDGLTSVDTLAIDFYIVNRKANKLYLLQRYKPNFS